MNTLELTQEQIDFLIQEVQDNNKAWNSLASDSKYDNKKQSYGLSNNKSYKELAIISDSILETLKDNSIMNLLKNN